MLGRLDDTKSKVVLASLEREKEQQTRKRQLQKAEAKERRRQHREQKKNEVQDANTLDDIENMHRIRGGTPSRPQEYKSR